MFKIATLSSNPGVLRYVAIAALYLAFTMIVHAGGAMVTVGPNSISASATVTGATSIELRVAGPNDYYAVQRSDSGSISWNAPYGLADGEYHYEVFVMIGSGAVDGMNDGGQLYRETGRFELQSGTLSVPSEPVLPPGPEAANRTDQASSWVARFAMGVIDFLVPTARATDITISDADPALYFNDTTVTGVDWELYGDDNFSYFWNYNTSRYIWSADDATPFFTHWGADYWRLYNYNQGVNSMYVDDTSGVNVLYADSVGNIGLADNSVFINKSANHLGIGTTTPQTGLQITSNYPEVRLDNTLGQTWDLIGGSIAWILEDVTNGSLPIYVDKAAPSNSLKIQETTGNIGLGTSAPSAALHVERDTNAKLLVRNTSATTAERVLLTLTNNGKNRFELKNGVNTWTFDNDGNFFNISKVGTGLNEFRVEHNGNGYFRGNSYALVHVDTSSREVKKDFKDLNEREVLTKLVNLPVTEWRYKQDGSRHFGPVAEDFQATFGLGDGKHIATVDTAGVTMAAIQGLYQVVQDKDKEIQAVKKEKDAQIEALKAEKDAQFDELKAENTALAERLKVLEKLILYKEVALAQ